MASLTRAALASKEGQMIFESGTAGHSVEVTGRHCTVKMNMAKKNIFVKIMTMVIIFNSQDPSGCLCGTESMISSICPLVKHASD